MAHEFLYERRVQFADTDMAGIVHFSWYFRYVEEAEHAFYRSLGFSVHGTVDEEPYGMPRLSARLEFLKPLRCEETVIVHLWVRRKGERSIVYQCRLRRGEEVVAQGEMAVASCRTLREGDVRAIPLPPLLARQIEEAGYPPLQFRGS